MIFQRCVIEELQNPLEITYGIVKRLLRKSVSQFSKLSKIHSEIAS